MIVNYHHKEPRREAGALGWQVFRSDENSSEQTKISSATPDPRLVPTTMYLQNYLSVMGDKYFIHFNKISIYLQRIFSFFSLS